ncbi:MAG: hypothetical protein AB7F23_09050 [Phycisphaerae bacterium]
MLDITFTSAEMRGVEELGVSTELGRAIDKAIYDCNVGRNDGLYEYRDMPYNQDNLDYALSRTPGSKSNNAIIAEYLTSRYRPLSSPPDKDGEYIPIDRMGLAVAVSLGLDAAELLAGARVADYLVGREQWQENPAAIIAAATFMNAPLRLRCKSMPVICSGLAELHGLCRQDGSQTAEILTPCNERGQGALYYTMRTSVDMLRLLRSQSEGRL